ncbi:hypothetical protein PSEUDO9AG_40167 [Pseudomonas sp. 9Ag]|nr:hypothetical protein PSEUDO9AG_40167 [Pseudomonas sp. 9Ag]
MVIRLVDQILHKTFERIGEGAAGVDLGVSQFVGKPIAAKQEQFIAAKCALAGADLQRFFAPEATHDDVAPGMSSSIGRLQLTSIYHHLHPAMVTAELHNPIGSDEIGSTVTHPDKLEIYPVEMRCDKGRAHTIIAGCVEHGSVRYVNGSVQRFASFYRLLQCRERQCTCDLTRLVTTHAVSDGPKAQRWRAEQSVFVVITCSTGRGEPGVFQQGGRVRRLHARASSLFLRHDSERT